MRDALKHLPVNWIDGMKINKNHFISQDDAWNDALFETASLATSPLRFGILPASAAGENNFTVRISLDNQNTIRVALLACQAVTPGGIRISLPLLNKSAADGADGVPSFSQAFQESKIASNWWVVLFVDPFEKQPVGSPDTTESPQRLPHVVFTYHIELVSENQYSQYSLHPYALTVGKIIADGNSVRVDQDYIPPCFSIRASQDLESLYMELDQFMARLESLCSQIVQTVYTKKQENFISELILFLCDRMMQYLGPAITNMRWLMIHESPAAMFASVASLARVMKNSIDLRIGSGKEEMLNYLIEWSELKQGEWENMLSSLAGIRYDHNDVNKNIQEIVNFVKVTLRLFETLSKLEFIGKRKDSGKFIKEEPEKTQPRRRFLG